MKSIITGIVISLLSSSALAAASITPAIIPEPQQIQTHPGHFTLTPETGIYTDRASRKTAAFLARELRRSTGYPFKVHTRFFSSGPVRNGIVLTTRSADAKLGPEGYALSATTNGVVVRAPAQAGLFYGSQTLRQLLPPQILSSNLVQGVDWQMPCVDIRDWPRFRWRGLMLDVSRHFFTTAEVERLLDLMALHKLNRFHWHLVDDQGWRIQIKKYPRLTQIGAWRKESSLDAKRTDNAHYAWMDPTPDKFGPDGRYGGFYTQDEIRRVVAYAAARHITVVPEIEMPGHSVAALTAYPEYGCFPGTNSTNIKAGVHNGIYCPANEGTFTFLDNVLAEVFKLFPGKYVHIGGDEVRKGYWSRSPECRALMKREGLTNTDELQSWFIKRIEKFVNAHGKTLVGWSEIRKGGLAPNAVVMDWIGGAREAASEGHDVVMSPTHYCYLNYYQSPDRAAEPRAQGGYISLKKVYSFEPVPEDLPARFQSHILGAQANLWTEWIASLPHAEYMLFPRLCALSEVVWSAKGSRNWDGFQRRLETDEQRLTVLGVKYHHETSTEITNNHLHALVSLRYPGFEALSLDSLGKQHFPLVNIVPPAKPWRPARAECRGARVEYRRPGIPDSQPPRWSIEVGTKEIRLESHWSADDPPEPLVFNADNSVSHVTLLGLMDTNGWNRLPTGVAQWKANRKTETKASIRLPAIMHFPGQGSFRITASPPAVKWLGYAAPSYQSRFVRIIFPAATRNHPVVKYRWEVVSIHPRIAGIASDPRFDGFRRDWLNIFQLSPHWGTLANHVSSDTCAFCYYEYADMAEHTPRLAKGVTALDMIRQTLDRIIGGAKAYGMPGHGAFPEYASDSLPSLLIAAEDYVRGAKDGTWLAANYDHLRTWTDKMLATDRDGNGLIEYSLSGDSGSWPARIKYRPSNWWDCIGFGHEDAYANALAYHALRGMEQLAEQSNHPADQARYRAAADKLKSAYYHAFHDPATGVLAGWRSADGQLHDYYFLWVNGAAIHYGLVSKKQGNAIMDHLLSKMKAVGYSRFDLGLPGNLIPVARKDYVDSRIRFGGGTKPDNSDGFQIYENGGATACFAYFTLAALYDLGRIHDGDRILFPMLEAFDRGDFQGHCRNGMSKDWKTWRGTCHGYEGFLTDNYYALLAVLDRRAALVRPETH